MTKLRSLDPGRLLIFGLSLVLTFALATGAGFALRTQKHASPTFAGSTQQQTGVKGVVQAVTADSITLKTDVGIVTLKVDATTPKEALQRTTLASVKPGDWVNAGGVHHDQTVYALTDLVIIPAANLEQGR